MRRGLVSIFLAIAFGLLGWGVWVARMWLFGWFVQTDWYLPVCTYLLRRGHVEIGLLWSGICDNLPGLMVSVVAGLVIGALAKRRWLLLSGAFCAGFVLFPFVSVLRELVQVLGAGVILVARWSLLLELLQAPIVLLAAWLVIRLRWREHWRQEGGLCVRCGYDLTGNVSGVCPECGTGVSTAKDAERSQREAAE